MFGKYFKHVLVLTLLAGTAYSLPQVKDAIGDAFAIGAINSAATVQAISPQPIVVRDINAKVVYDRGHKESAINITAKIQITANDSDLTLTSNGSIYGNLKNKNFGTDTYFNLSTQSSNNRTNPDGSITIKRGSSVLVTATGSINPSGLIAGQYNAFLNIIVLNNNKFPVPSNKSNTIVVVGEASPYITLVGQGMYGTKDTVVLNSVRLGKNPTITFQQANLVCPVGMICQANQQTFALKMNGKSNQIKFNLADYNITAGQYYIYVTNIELGASAGKSNFVYINVLDQSKLINAKVFPGNLALSFDTNQKESALSAPFTVTIKAGDKDISFGQGAFGVIAQNESGNQMYSQANIVYINKADPIFPFNLKANTEATFYIMASANPKLMFAGNYSMSLIGIYPLTPVNSTITAIQVPENKTNSVIIIGETSPYINSITPNPVVAGNVFQINGLRLDKSNVYIDGINYGVNPTINNVTTLNLPASTTDGYHMLSVKNFSAGESNTIWFQSTGGVIVPPVLVCPAGYVCSPIGGTTYTCPSGFVCTPVITDCPAGYSCTTQTPVVIVPPATSVCFTFTTNLTVGSTGPDVVALQNFLIRNGFLATSTSMNDIGSGYFGAQTKAAVMKYQLTVGIAESGFIGPITRASLNACPPIVVVTPVTPLVSLSSSPAGTQEGYQFFNYNISSSQQFNSLKFRFDCNINEIEVSTKGGGSCGETLINGFNSTNNYLLYVGYKSKDGKPHTIGLSVSAMKDTTIIGSDKDALTIQPLISVAISNTYINKGAIVLDSTGTKQIQPTSFGFTLTAGNDPIFLSTSVTDTGTLAQNSSIVFAAKNNIVPIKINYTSTSAQSGDTANYFYIAPGTSRQFVFDSKVSNVNNDGYNIAQIVAINYGINANNLSAYSITSGLENLKVIYDVINVVTQQPSITITSPNGGEKYTQGQIIPISFSTNLTSQQAPNGFNIILYFGGNSTNAGTFSSGVQTIAFRYTGSSPYNWSIPTNLAPGNYLVYIVPDQLAPGISNKGLFDFGDNYFTIISQTPKTTPATIDYNCPSGYSVSGTNCVKPANSVAASATYSCPTGYTITGNDCISITKTNSSASYTSTIQASKNYYCQSGYVLSGSMCNMSSISVPAIPNYSCPSGGILSGNTCIITTSVNSLNKSNTASVWDSFLDWFVNLF